MRNRSKKVGALAGIIMTAAIAACVADGPDTGTGSGNDDGGADSVASADGGGDVAVTDGASCDAPKVSCGGACVDPSAFVADGKNCGACGHDCLGASCSKSACGVATVHPASGTDAGSAAIGSITSDATKIYFSAPIGSLNCDAPVQNPLYACALPSCTTPTAVLPGSKGDFLLTDKAAPGLLYFSTNCDDNVYRVITGSDAGNGVSAAPCVAASDPYCIASHPGSPYPLASDGTSVYLGTNTSGGSGTASKFNLPNGAGQSNFGSAYNGGTGDGLVAVALDPDDTSHKYLYAVTPHNVVAYDTTQASATAPTAIYNVGQSSPNPAGGIAVAGHQVFFSDITNDVMSVAVCPAAGCGSSHPTQTLASMTPGALQITADDNHVYWAAGTSIYACPPGGCASNPPPALATTPHKITALASDATSVFWGDELGGVYRIAK